MKLEPALTGVTYAELAMGNFHILCATTFIVVVVSFRKLTQPPHYVHETVSRNPCLNFQHSPFPPPHTHTSTYI